MHFVEAQWGVLHSDLISSIFDVIIVVEYFTTVFSNSLGCITHIYEPLSYNNQINCVVLFKKWHEVNIFKFGEKLTIKDWQISIIWGKISLFVV